MIQILFIFVLQWISSISTIINQVSEVQYYENGLNRYFLDHTLSLSFEFVKEIEITNNLKKSNCQAIPYEFSSNTIAGISSQKIISTYFDSEQKILFVIEAGNITYIQFSFTKKSISVSEFRSGIVNEIENTLVDIIEFQSGVQITKLEKNKYIILDESNRYFILNLTSKTFELFDTIPYETPIWISSIDQILIVAINNSLIKFILENGKLEEVTRTEINLVGSKILSIRANYLFIQLQNNSIIKVQCSGNFLNYHTFSESNDAIISQSVNNEKLSYLTQDRVVLFKNLTIQEKFDQIFHLEDLIILQSNKGVNKVLTEFTSLFSDPTFFYHENVEIIYLMNQYGINYHIISCSKDQIIINEISFTEAFIECEGNLNSGDKYISFIAQADKCNLYHTQVENQSCQIEGKLHFNLIKTYASDYGIIGLIIEISVIIFFTFSLLALLYTKNMQRKIQELTKQAQEIEFRKENELERSEQNIINQKESE